MENLKKLLAIVLLIAIGLLSTGCTKKQTDQTPVDSTSVVPSDREITLIWWNLFEPQENVQPIIDAYQAKYPNVKIEYSEKNISDYRSTLDSVLTDGLPESTPDIFTINNYWVKRYSNYIISAPTDIIDATIVQKDFYPVVYNDVVINGRVKGLPLGIDAIAIIYNKDLLQDKGYTVPSDNWNELFEQAKALTTKDANGVVINSGISIGAYDNAEFWFDVFNLLLMQSDIKMVDSTGNEAIFASDPAFSEAVSYFRKYQDEGVWDKNRKKDIALFLEGKLAFYIAPSWRLLDIIKYNKEYNLGLNIGVAPVPQLSSLENEDVGWATYWVQAVSMDSRNYKVAWDFLKFATEETQLQLGFNKQKETRAFGELYPRVDMKEQLENEEYLDVFINEVSHAKNWQMVDSLQVKTVFEDLLTKNTSVDTTEGRITSILKRDGFLSTAN